MPSKAKSTKNAKPKKLKDLAVKRKGSAVKGGQDRSLNLISSRR